MNRRRLGTWTVLAAAAVLLLLVPGTGEAQVRIGIGVQRGNFGFYYGNFPYYRGYYPGYYPGYGYPGYGYVRPGLSFGIGTYPYYYPSSVYVNRYYTPYVSVPRYATDYGSYYSGSGAAYTVQPPPATYPETPRADNTATVELRVPAQAKVYFDGALTTQTGANRRYVTPELVPGYDYTYVIRASWTADGREMSEERKVVVQAGQQYRLDLTGEALPAPKKEQP